MAYLTKQYEIYYHDIDAKKRLLLTSLVNYLADISIDQSQRLGVGMQINEKGYAWVLYKWDIDISTHPTYGQKVFITTMPYSFRKFYCYRTYEIKNENGDLLGTAKSQWILIDIDKRRIVRVPNDVWNVYGVDRTDELPMKDVEPMVDPQYSIDFNIRYSDIDTNMHVNNSKYISWALETVPLEVIKNMTLENITMIYKKETNYGHKITSLTEVKQEEDRTICLHKIVAEDGTELNIAQSSWKKSL